MRPLTMPVVPVVVLTKLAAVVGAVAGDADVVGRGAQVRAMLVVVRFEAVTLVGAVGGWVSAQAAVVTARLAREERLPAAS